MKVFVGLGNPGDQYSLTRHNAGILLVDQLASLTVGQSSYGWRKFYGIMVYKTAELIFVKTADYFMNESGNVGRDVLRLDEIKGRDYELVLAHDDLDIRLGDYKIQKGIGPKQHNGVDAVEVALGTKDFERIRIGVDNRDKENRMPGEDYVLQRFNAEEREKLEGVLNAIAEAIN